MDARLLVNNMQQCCDLLPPFARMVATLLANNMQHCLGPKCCVRLHGTTTVLALVAYSLKPVKLWRNKSQHFHCSKRSATILVAPVCMEWMEPQKCWPRENVWARVLHSFLRITILECIASLDNRQQCWQLLRLFACTTQQLPTMLG